MKKIFQTLLAAAILLIAVPIAFAGATKEDVIKAVNQAVALLQQEGGAGLEKAGEIRFGDGNYVFVNSLDGTTLMHIKKHLVGKNLVAMGLKDDKGKNFFMEFTQVAQSPEGEGWVNYRWTKPGDKTKFYDKTTYIKKTTMDGKEVYVGAGIYL